MKGTVNSKPLIIYMKQNDFLYILYITYLMQLKQEIYEWRGNRMHYSKIYALELLVTSPTTNPCCIKAYILYSDQSASALTLL